MSKTIAMRVNHHHISSYQISLPFRSINCSLFASSASHLNISPWEFISDVWGIDKKHSFLWFQVETYEHELEHKRRENQFFFTFILQKKERDEKQIFSIFLFHSTTSSSSSLSNIHHLWCIQIYIVAVVLEALFFVVKSWWWARMTYMQW